MYWYRQFVCVHHAPRHEHIGQEKHRSTYNFTPAPNASECSCSSHGRITSEESLRYAPNEWVGLTAGLGVVTNGKICSRREQNSGLSAHSPLTMLRIRTVHTLITRCILKLHAYWAATVRPIVSFLTLVSVHTTKLLLEKPLFAFLD